MLNKSKMLSALVAASATLFVASCDGDKGRDDENEFKDGGCPGCGSGGGNGGSYSGEATGLALDIEGVKALARSSEDSSAGLHLGEAAADAESSLTVLTDDGAKPALVPVDPERADSTSAEIKADKNSNAYKNLPRVAAVGVSPKLGRMFVLFERWFNYMVPPANYTGDIWSGSSEYNCQLFEYKSTVAEGKSTKLDTANGSNLRCIAAGKEIPIWRGKDTQIMQFDQDGNLYFPAHIPGSWQDVFFKYDPLTQATKEMINANICFRNAKVLGNGGIFYTGNSYENNGCNGSSFFRYISPANTLIQVAQDWWDFKYEQLELGGETPSNKILFYGPNPSSSSGSSWSTACLYTYDPKLPAAQRTTPVAHCTNDVWSYRQGTDLASYTQSSQTLAHRVAMKSRCQGEGRVALGGSSISQLGQDGVGNVVIAAQMKAFSNSSLNCSLTVSEAHCSTLNPAHTTQQLCTGTWYTGTGYYSGVTTDACLVTSDAAEESVADGIYHRPNWSASNANCSYASNGSNGDGTDTVDGIGYLTVTDSRQYITLLSEKDEKAKTFWSIYHGATEGTVVYYSSLKDGEFRLRSAKLNSDGTVTRKTLMSSFEVYQVYRSPDDQTKLMVNGLDFSNNAYTLGTIDPFQASEEAVRESTSSIVGITSKVEELIFSSHFSSEE